MGYGISLVRNGIQTMSILVVDHGPRMWLVTSAKFGVIIDRNGVVASEDCLSPVEKILIRLNALHSSNFYLLSIHCCFIYKV